jgi:hypothetical protein
MLGSLEFQPKIMKERQTKQNDLNAERVLVGEKVLVFFFCLFFWNFNQK